MPNPTNPPSLAMSQTIFNDLKSMTFDSTTGGFYDANDALNFLFIDVDSNGNARWTYAPSTSTVSNLKAKATDFTGTVIGAGTYDTQSGTISYGGQSYKFRLERDSNGVAVANAHT